MSGSNSPIPSLSAQQRKLLNDVRHRTATDVGKGLAPPWVVCVPGDARPAKSLRDKGLLELNCANPSINDRFWARLSAAQVEALKTDKNYAKTDTKVREEPTP